MMHNWFGPAGNYMLQGNWWWMGAIGIAVRVILLIVVIYFLVKLLKRYEIGRTGSDQQRSTDEAMRILRERYAKGEIDTEEFQRRKADLE